ncbi:MAG: putative lipoate-protein ligase A [Candidatus Anoxychlamydiales bacterium]|nr:putative lipoate-protein ligase A [Candidatus Anoxychlamydiales bacterium]
MLNFLHLKKINILTQLNLEEKFLRNFDEPFCIINEGTSDAIILGISNLEKDLVHLQNTKKDKIPLIKRFTAGGCVFVDQNTLFVTFIFSKKYLDITFFPEPILRWAETFYKKVFDLKSFKLIENDFVIDDKKVAGNAMYIKKDRFLLHSSFLLDFDKNKMQKYLKTPKITPQYRKDRAHSNFLAPIKSRYSKDEFIQKIKIALKNSFNLKDYNLSQEKLNFQNSSSKIL